MPKVASVPPTLCKFACLSDLIVMKKFYDTAALLLSLRGVVKQLLVQATSLFGTIAASAPKIRTAKVKDACSCSEEILFPLRLTCWTSSSKCRQRSEASQQTALVRHTGGKSARPECLHASQGDADVGFPGSLSLH